VQAFAQSRQPRAGLLGGDAVEDLRELLAADPRQHIAVAARGAADPGELREHPVVAADGTQDVRRRPDCPAGRRPERVGRGRGRDRWCGGHRGG